MVCQGCQAQFEPRYLQQLYCNRKCQQRTKRRRQGKRLPSYSSDEGIYLPSEAEIAERAAAIRAKRTEPRHWEHAPGNPSKPALIAAQREAQRIAREQGEAARAERLRNQREFGNAGPGQPGRTTADADQRGSSEGQTDGNAEDQVRTPRPKGRKQPANQRRLPKPVYSASQLEAWADEALAELAAERDAKAARKQQRKITSRSRRIGRRLEEIRG